MTTFDISLESFHFIHSANLRLRALHQGELGQRAEVSPAGLGLPCPNAKTEIAGELGAPFHGVSGLSNFSQQGIFAADVLTSPLPIYF